MDRFVELGITKREVPIMFLNVCSNNRLPMWNLFLNPTILKMSSGNFNIDSREWDTMLNIVSRVDDPALRDAMSGYLNALRRSVVATHANFENSVWIMNRFRTNLFYGIA
jgi:hypothetical protein